jgi:RimJ/RimL family protein N-acetyltransferase
MKPKVKLRNVQPGDLPFFFEHQLDPVALRMAAFTSRQRDAFDAHWAKILANDQVDKQTILLGEQVVGNIGSFDREGMREVGYWIAREHWGKGIATQALELFLQLVPRRPLFARVATHNLGSLRVLRKCGFADYAEEDGEPDAEGDPVREFVLVRED